MENLTRNYLEYPYDGPGKRLTRFLFWSEVRKRLTAEQWKKGPHLVLAGPRAEDVIILRAMGVPARAIVMVDHNEQFLNLAAAVHHDVVAVYEDVETYVTNESYRFASIYLDFCATACKNSLQIAAKVCKRGLQRNGVFGTTYYSSRENEKALLATINKAKKLLGTDPAGARLAAVSIHLRRAYGKGAPSPQHAWYYLNDVNKPLMVILWQNKQRQVVPLHNVDPSAWDEHELAKQLGWDLAGYLLCLPAGTVAAFKAHDTRKREQRSRRAR